MHYTRYKNMSHTLQMGRWQDSATARIYIAEGAQALLELCFPAAQLQHFALLANALAADVPDCQVIVKR